MMPEPSVRRIRGFNIRVSDLSQALDYYTTIIGLKVYRVFDTEAFLRWAPQREEDFLGLFVGQ